MGRRQKQHMGRSAEDDRTVAGRDIPDDETGERLDGLASGRERPRAARGEPNAETEGLPRDGRGHGGA